MVYTEEREFSLRIELKCAFPDDYGGEDDGYAWVSEFHGMVGEIVSATMRLIASRPGWTVRTGNRGRSSEDEVVLVAERDPVKK